MSQKKTISIDKNIPKALVIGLLLGFLTVFVVEHFSKISYVADTYEIQREFEKQRRSNNLNSNDPLEKAYAVYESSKEFSFSSYDTTTDTPILSILLTTPFDSKLRIDGRGYIVGDLWEGGDFHDYPNKSKHYIKATFEDTKYLLYFGIGYFLLILLFSRFNFKLI